MGVLIIKMVPPVYGPVQGQRVGVEGKVLSFEF